MTSQTVLQQLEERIPATMLSDQFRLRRQIQNARKRRSADDESWQQLRDRIEASVARREARRKSVPASRYPEDLPISARHEEIADAIRQHQVVVVCGETGSGKSTQLPKICLDIGQGVAGLIGHTQPRRVAARSVASRLAEELNCPLGQAVGYKIRFNDVTNPKTLVKLMTDGILLAETQSDRFLEQYDTLIIDEAHERSLNIDFLIGYLKQLSDRRRNLKVIITSATIDAERFSEHFSRNGRPVPIVEVSGRTYPVETRYRPLEDEEDDESDGRLNRSVVDGVAELTGEGPGDVLIFLPTEREIRDVSRSLRGWVQKQSTPAEVLPLYARLPQKEQSKVFRPGKHRRLILATNVAESSLTVPGIRYVVDAGTARISRYAARSRVQRLPIENVSRASADQRQGRCGRLGPGVCVRLYSEDDYLSRDEYTTPEIRRTNLASVILQMLSLRMGRVDQFPFLDPPRPESIREGYKTLFELGATDASQRLTKLGRLLSSFPVDPRIGRMILAAEREQCLQEVLIIAAALEIQDPRVRPEGKQTAADECHQQFTHEHSDFLTLLNIWDFYHKLKADLSRSKLRKACEQNYLSHLRMREWQEIHRQLQQLVRERGLKGTPRRDDYDSIHRALATGLLYSISRHSDRNEYEGAGGAKAQLWPGSGLYSQRPKWIIAAEVVETSRRFLRTVARIKPEWIEPLADHLVKRTYENPFWSRKQQTAMSYQKVSLFGLTIASGRRKPYGKIDPDVSRQLFIQHGLVDGELKEVPGFLWHNQALIEELQQLGAKSRTAGYLVPEGIQLSFYEQAIPTDVFDLASLKRWMRRADSNEVAALTMSREDLLPQAAGDPAPEQFPSQMSFGELGLQIDYRYQPGDEDDGVSVEVPLEGLGQLDSGHIEWLVPGMLEEKIVALIRLLPKSVRRNLVPAPESARKAAAQLEFGVGSFPERLASVLSKLADERIAAGDLKLDQLPQHLRVNVRVLDNQKQLIEQGRDVAELRQKLQVDEPEKTGTIDDDAWNREGITIWDLESFPEKVELVRGGVTLLGYPMLVDSGTDVSLRLADRKATAKRQTARGLRRLCCIHAGRDLKSQVNWLPALPQAEIQAATLAKGKDLRAQLVECLAGRSFVDGQPVPRSAPEFEAYLAAGQKKMLVVIQDLAKLIGPLFDAYHQVRLTLDDLKGSNQQHARCDMQNQLKGLMGPEFLSETPWQWLEHYPRYLNGIRHRAEKLRSGGEPRDRELRDELAPLVEQYHHELARLAETQAFDAELEMYGWMLEEYRVSLFAQQLGTAFKISARRLEKQWSKVGR